MEFTRRGRPKPTATGPLCLSNYLINYDRRLDDSFSSFKKFNRSLVTKCAEGEPAILEITPNLTWPDTVYYNSFTHPNMGWKIHIVDSFNGVRSSGKSLISQDKNYSKILSIFVVFVLREYYSKTRFFIKSN